MNIRSLVIGILMLVASLFGYGLMMSDNRSVGLDDQAMLGLIAVVGIYLIYAAFAGRNKSKK